MITSEQLRQQFLDFMVERGHKIIPSASLLPENDPSVLFTTAGMHPLVPFLLGEPHPQGKRLANSQKCLRTDDIDEIGDIQHLSFFEMLGYWSLGDYFKKESIHFTFDFFTQILGINKDKISVSVFKGDKDAPFDAESFDVWKNEIGIPENRIFKYNKKENWWGLPGTGPCGPCTEIFFDTGIPACDQKDCGPSCDCDKFVELGNNVFMEYFKNEDGNFTKLKQKNVDVGLGFERLVMMVQNKKSVFETDLFEPIVTKIKTLSSKESENSLRIIADHLRSTTFAIADGAVPSNTEAGYIVRRLIRRSIRHGRDLGIKGNFTVIIAKEVIKKMGKIYPELKQNEQLICSELQKEEEKFSKTLERGIKQLELLSKTSKLITGKMVFDLFQTYGFPVEMTEELAKEKGIKIDNKGFETEFAKHQELSRKGAEAKFKGGLANSGETETKYHTATHLLHKALQIVLGDHAKQSGSNITAERLRFDFTNPEKMTPEQITETENIVNEQIKAKLPVIMEIMTVEQARKKGALGLFESKYGNEVKVYTIGDPLKPFSVEICGGPHVNNTSDLGVFKITKEESSSAGIRRIKAILANN